MLTSIMHLFGRVSRGKSKIIHKSASKIVGTFLGTNQSLSNRLQSQFSLLNRRYFVTLSSFNGGLSPSNKFLESKQSNKRKQTDSSRKCRFSNYSVFSPLCQLSHGGLLSKKTLFGHQTLNSGGVKNSKTIDINQVNLIQKAHLFGFNFRKVDKFDYIFTSERPEGRWPIKQALVETCKDLYEDYPYPVRFDVTFLDANSQNRQGQTVMFIHGAPGSHHDFLPIIDVLAEKGVRVVAPNMPGFGKTKSMSKLDEEAYLQTTEECAEFLVDFLIEIGSPKIDMIVAHSTGCSTAMNILSRLGGVKGVKALTAICPIPHSLECMEPPMFVRTLAKNKDNFLWKSTVKRFIRNKAKQFGFTAADDEHMLQSLLAISHTQLNDLGSHAMSLNFQQFPVLALYTEDDRFVSPDKTASFLELLGISQARIESCNVEEEVHSTGDGLQSEYPRGLMLNAGGHHPHVKYPKVLAEEILKFLDHLSSKDSKL